MANKYTNFETIREVLAFDGPYMVNDKMYRDGYSQFDDLSKSFDLIVSCKDGSSPRVVKIFADDFSMHLLELNFDMEGNDVSQTYRDYSDEIKMINLQNYGDEYAKDLSLYLHKICADTYKAYNDLITGDVKAFDGSYEELMHQRDIDLYGLKQNMLSWISYAQMNKKNGYKIPGWPAYKDMNKEMNDEQ